MSDVLGFPCDGDPRGYTNAVYYDPFVSPLAERATGPLGNGAYVAAPTVCSQSLDLACFASDPHVAHPYNMELYQRLCRQAVPSRRYG